MASDIEIEALDPSEIERLRPLWLLLHAHHQAVAPETGPFVDDTTSWEARRQIYAGALAAGGFALIAREGATDLGYTLAGPEPTPWPSLLASEEDVYDLHTILVREGPVAAVSAPGCSRRWRSERRAPAPVTRWSARSLATSGRWPSTPGAASSRPGSS